MINSVDKKISIISSLGRSGSTFLHKYFCKNLKDIQIRGEHGLVDLKKPFNYKNISNIKNNNIFETIFNKFSYRDVRKISARRIEGAISDSQAIEYLIKARHRAIHKNSKHYLENNYYFYGVLDLIKYLGRDYRIVHIVRDPRDWIRSHINFSAWYAKNDIQIILNNRIRKNFLKKQNRKYSQFDYLAYNWSLVTDHILKNQAVLKNIKVYKFEDLFGDDIIIFKNFIKFILFDNTGDIKFLFDDLKVVCNPSPEKKSFPNWREWDKDTAKKVNIICGSVMQKFGYGQEDEWIEKIKNN